ncbi:MAG: hypothetical protein QW684_04015 [Candidatus Nitrosocaldus sp.]
MTTPIHAAYNIGTQGIQVKNTTGTFTRATVQDEVRGVRFENVGATYGFGTQNNAFLRPQVIGQEFLWAQSIVLAKAPSGVTYSTYNCRLQDGSSFSCAVPSQIELVGHFELYTKPGIGGCDALDLPGEDWTLLYTGECNLLKEGMTITVTMPSATNKPRIDLNAYAQVNTSTGKLYVDQKYRICQGGTCGTYTKLFSYTTQRQLVSQGGHFDLGTISGDIYFPIAATVGYCCSLRVNFQTGTFITHVYTINTSATPEYRPTTVNKAPSEENGNYCWWDTISNPGGTNPTYRTSAKYGNCNS